MQYLFIKARADSTREEYQYLTKDGAVQDLSFVSCWINGQNEDDAALSASKEIIEAGYLVEEILCNESKERRDYDEDNEHLQYFDQALIDDEVFVFGNIPRFPVYYLELSATSKRVSHDEIEVRAWVSNELVAKEGEDCFQKNFWSEERISTAISIE